MNPTTAPAKYARPANGLPVRPPQQSIAEQKADEAKLDEQHWQARVKELLAPSLVRPALTSETEVKAIEARFATFDARLAALEARAAERLAWLDARDGFQTKITLSELQAKNAAAFFVAHPPVMPTATTTGETPPKPPSPVAQAVAGLMTPATPATPATPSKPAKESSDMATLMLAQVQLLARIADAVEQLARASAPKAPNYQRALTDFPAFDWSTINATVKAKDAHGASAVEWNDYVFTRRSGEGKFGEAIWFSRPTGKDAEGNNTYARLVTFKNPTDAEPLAKKVAAKV